MDGFDDLWRRTLLLAVPLIIGFMILMMALPKPQLPTPQSLNGQYYNQCCGSFEVSNSRLLVNQKAVRFDLEFDKIGLYAIPNQFFGVENGKRFVMGGEHPLKLRIDSEAKPSSIELWDRNSNRSYVFSRI